MNAKSKDTHGRLTVHCFYEILCQYLKDGRAYHAHQFKRYIEGLGILTEKDWDLEPNGRHTRWKHRIDRAYQRYSTGI